MSLDPVALDTVFWHLIHLKPELVPTNYHGEKMGLGVMQTEQIELYCGTERISLEEAVSRFGREDFAVDRRKGSGQCSCTAGNFSAFKWMDE